MSRDPFALLGLSATDENTDDEVRAAWRRIAAATHPDRSDGGEPERFALAAAAYTELRTAFGRGEARAALASSSWTATDADGIRDPADGLMRRAGSAWPFGWRRALGAVPSPGSARSLKLMLRAGIAVIAGVGGVLAAGHGPAGPALAVGAATWLAVTSWRDLRSL